MFFFKEKIMIKKSTRIMGLCIKLSHKIPLTKAINYSLDLILLIKKNENLKIRKTKNYKNFKNNLKI